MIIMRQIFANTADFKILYINHDKIQEQRRLCPIISQDSNLFYFIYI